MSCNHNELDKSTLHTVLFQQIALGAKVKEFQIIAMQHIATEQHSDHDSV